METIKFIAIIDGGEQVYKDLDSYEAEQLFYTSITEILAGDIEVIELYAIDTHVCHGIATVLDGRLIADFKGTYRRIIKSAYIDDINIDYRKTVKR